MTITYTAEVATCSGFGCFVKLLARWRGGIYKLIWMDLIVFILLYYLLLLIYLFALSGNQQRLFENVVEYCNGHGSLIPISFVLGFYVATVMKRWWDQYMYIPWPDSIAVYVSAHVQGNDERARVMRRTVMRYVCLCLAIVLARMSPCIKKRFSTWDHFVTAGLLQESEKEIIQKLDHKFPAYPKHWMPIVWSASIIVRARREGRIRDDCAVKTIVDELNKFRASCAMLLYYDFISIPLVYTQVVTLAVYWYFLASLMGRQPVPNVIGGGVIGNTIYFPIFTTLEFFFYMGWLKVAESLINPFGDDDDDFEVNWIIDRHLQVSYMIVDEMHQEHPELVRDQYWDEVFPSELPYANEKDIKREEPPEASTARIGLSVVHSQTQIDQARIYRQSHSIMSMERLSVLSSWSTLNLAGSSSSSSEGAKKIAIVNPLQRKGPGRIPSPPSVSDDSFNRLRMERENRRRTRQRFIFARASYSVDDNSARPSFFAPVRKMPIRESEISEAVLDITRKDETEENTAVEQPSSQEDRFSDMETSLTNDTEYYDVSDEDPKRDAKE